MRFREPLLGGSAAMPGASLQRACRLLVAVCALHLGVTLVYYLAGRDLRRLPQLVGVSTPLQGGSNGAAAIGQPSGELRARGVRPPPPLGASSQPRPGGDSSPVADSGPGPANNLTSVPVPRTTALALPLPACPEESPLLVGPMLIEFNMPVDLELVAKQNPNVKMGGRYTPKDCISPHKVAIIIPFRNRQEHLKYWLYYLHPVLQRQQLNYGIYVINQFEKIRKLPVVKASAGLLYCGGGRASWLVPASSWRFERVTCRMCHLRRIGQSWGLSLVAESTWGHFPQ
uniref:beta-1,4-galactosyltransferase 1 isoform X3 n=1 Tax=Callithrix jacchus TaxID=9483 RepID=UPI00159EB3CA|nr:beta-1,4-galactosyltransferase 1 isoform X3 [Callithrix jacchus]